MSTMAPTGHGLPKITVEKLESIRQRRTSLLLTRTAALFGCAFLGLLMVSALADRFWNISDLVRAVLGLSTYGIAILVLLFSIYPLFRRWSLPDAARCAEENVATLRDKLLSAVELPTDSSDPRLGSLELRGELQAIVAEELRSLDVGSVLPWRRIRTLVLALLGMGSVAVVLSLMPSLNLPQHFWRILLPIANLPRPSLADVQLLDPRPDAVVLPLNEPQLFRAQVSLPDSERERLPEELHLEIRTHEPRPEVLRLPMKLEARVEAPLDSGAPLSGPETPLAQPAFFTELVPIEHRSFDYRVVSDVGETRWFSALAAERPRLVEFAMVVTPPDYSGAATESRSATSADVEVIAGSRVSWTLQTNVPVAEANLRWRSATAAAPAAAVPWVRDKTGAWTFAELASESRSFQLDLTSEQGLSSTFPPTYQLTVRADQAPQITWTKPKELTRVIRPRSAAMLQVAVVDEYPVQSLEQWSRVNRGSWRKDMLGTPSSATAEVDWTWEMAVLNAKIGDWIETKIVAVDRMGQTGESPISEWVVSGTELNPSRDPETLVREEIDRLIARLQPIVRGKQTRLQELTEAWRRDVNNTDTTAQLTGEIRTSVDDVSRLLDDTQTQVTSLMGELRRPLALEEVHLLVDAMTQWSSELRVIRLTLESSINREANEQRSGLLDRFRGRYEHVLYNVDRLPLISQATVSHDILLDFSRDLEDALRFQRELLRDEESIGTKIWQREQTVLSEYLTRVGQDMGAHSRFLPEGPARGLRDWGQLVEQIAERSASLVEAESVESHQVQSIADEIRDRVNLLQLYSWLPDEVNNMRRELFQHSGRTRELLIRAMHEWHHERQYSADASVPTATFLTAMEALRQRRATRYSRADHSSVYAADLGLAHRALEHQIALNSGNPPQVDQRIQQIAEAVGVIESGQRVENARHFLDAALATERFAATSGIARTENPRLWDAFGQQLEWAHEDMRRTENLPAIGDVIHGLRWNTAAQAVGQKISRRRWDLVQVPVSAASDLESIRIALTEQETLLQPWVDEARRLLAELAPPIAQLAQSSAAAAEVARTETEQLQQQLRADEVPNIAERLQQHQTRLEQTREPTSQRLKEALVDRAAAQDLLDQQQLKQAQVADLARQLIQAAEQQTAEATQAATEQAQNVSTEQESPQVAESLDALQQAQAREVETLQAIAEHFAREPGDATTDPPSATPSVRADTLAQLAQLEKREQFAPSAQEQDQALDPAPQDSRDSLERDAEALAALSEADPRDLLRSLEQALTRDEQMQEELADIARTLAEQSQRSLEHAAQREDELRQRLEQSDVVREPLRREFAQELDQAFQKAEQIAQRMQHETREQAAAGKQTLAQQKLETSAAELQEAIQAARQQAASGFNDDLKQAAQALHQALQEVQPELNAAQESLAANNNESPFNREDQQRQMQNWANQTQDALADRDREQADREVQSRQQQKQQAEQVVQQGQQNVAQAEQQLNQLREQLQSQPDNEWLKQQVPEIEANIAQQREVQQTWENIRQRAEQRTQAAQNARQQHDQRPASLEAPNPHSELAARLSQQAANRAAALSQDLNQLMNQAGFMSETQADRRGLEQAAEQQANVQGQVATAAEDLQQAAAHQNRLGADQSAQALQEAAQDVANTANQEPRVAQTQMQQATASRPDAAESLPANANDTQRVDQSLQAASAALQQRAEELGQILGESLPPDRASNENAPENESGQNPNQNSGQSSNNANNANNANSSNTANSGEPSPLGGNSILAQMGPRAKAELLDQLARQTSRSESGTAPTADESSGPPTADASQSAQERAAQESPAMQSPAMKNGALQSAAQVLRRQLQQQRAQQMSRSSSTPSNSPRPAEGTAVRSGAAPMDGPTGAGTARVLATDPLSAEPVGAWSRLREQKSSDVTESQMEAVSPRYRRQIENYFKVLSEKSRETK